MPNWFVLLSLFLPRLTLFCCWIIGAMPANETPFLIDIVGFLVAPRLLIAAWLWADPAWGGLWAGVFVFASLFAGGGQAEAGRRRWRSDDDD